MKDLHIVSNMSTIVPIMSTIENDLLSGLFGKTRKSILALLCTHPDESFYLRQILRLAGVAHGAGQRELKWLVESGIITRRVSGNQVYFQVNKNFPIYSELQTLIIKTAGIVDVLKTALAQLSDRIIFALIYGSAAKGQTSKWSDIDALVVGDVSFAEIGEKLVPAQKTLQRELYLHSFIRNLLNQMAVSDYYRLINAVNEPIKRILSTYDRDQMRSQFWKFVFLQPAFIPLGIKLLSRFIFSSNR